MHALLKNRFMISTISFALLLVALVVLLIIPSFREIKVINEQVIEERTRLERLYTKGQLQKAVQQNYESIKNDINFLDEAILTENQELRYITDVEELAERTGVSVALSVGASKREPERRYSTLDFTITARGGWEQLSRFSAELEALPYYTNIKELTVSAREQEGTSARTATLTMNAATYWRIPSL